MPPIFLAFLIVSALAAALVVGCIVASLLFFVCFGWVVGCGLWFSFPSDGMTKRKGAPCWRVLASWVVGLWLSYCVGYYETIAGGFYP